jgi:hypothetical protein
VSLPLVAAAETEYVPGAVVPVPVKLTVCGLPMEL